MVQKNVSKPGKEESSQVMEILRRHPAQKANLIPALQDIQDHFGFLPEHAIDQLSAHKGTSVNEIYGVATFYTQFRFNPPGEHTVRVCQGTACHVRLGQYVLDEIEKQLGIKAGQTTADGKFDLERVACLGCCALAPVMMIDDKVHARIRVKEIGSILSQHAGTGTDLK
jgi:NADH-quinone oxidoreductase subunit E